MKKILSIIICLATLSSFVTALPASAALETAVGEDGKTYHLIYTPDDYLDFVTAANADLSINGKLMADIDLEGKAVKTIGKIGKNQAGSTPYTGTFDGNEHVIKNMTISAKIGSSDTKKGLAMFVCLGSTAVVKDLGIENALIEPKYDQYGSIKIGVITAASYDSTVISNCYVRNSSVIITAKQLVQAVGIFAGVATRSSTIENCYSIGNTIEYTEDSVLSVGTTNGVSGFVGYRGSSAGSGAIIKNCYAKDNTIKNVSDDVIAGICAPSTDGITAIAENTFVDKIFTKDASVTEVTVYESGSAEWETLASTLGDAWTNDETGVNGGAPVLAWEYEPILYNITVDSEIANGVVEADMESAAEGETVTLTVTPDEGYLLDWVKVNGEELEYPYTFTMPAEDVVITASFIEEITVVLYDITIDSSITNGTVTTHTYEAQEGDTIALTVTPDEECVIDWVKVNGVEISAPYTFTMPAEDVTITASFSEIPKYAITIEESTNGSVTSSKTLAKAGEEITLTVTPDNDYKVKSVKINGEELASPYTFTMPANEVIITAEFEEIEYFLIYTPEDYLAFVEAANADLSINGKLMADLDMSTVTKTDIHIGNYGKDKVNDGVPANKPYTGIFDGNYHVIRNITIKKDLRNDSNSGVAMFNMTDGATIKNLGVENADIWNTRTAGDGRFYYGGVLVAYAKGATTIENCYVKNSKISRYYKAKNDHWQYAGFIAGQFSGSEGVVNNCYSLNNTIYFDGTPSADGNAAGFIGSPGSASITNSYAKGTTFSNSKSYGFTRTQTIFETCYTDSNKAASTGYTCGANVITDENEWATLANTLGSAYKSDTFSINGGAPRLAWEKDPVEYNITVSADIVNGTVIAPSKAFEGTEVALSFTCADGYAVDRVYVNGEEISYPYTFTMPSEDVVISATFVLEIGLAETDAEMITGIPESAKEGFTLPITGEKHNSLITWTSDDSSIAIDNATGEAVVTRYNYQTGDKTVTLTAEVKYGSASVTKTFEVVVLKLMPDADYVNAIFETITWATLSEESETAVTKNLTLPEKYNDDIVYTWSSNKLYYVTNGGAVTRPMYGDETIKLTLSYKLELGGEVKKVFTFVVKGGMANSGSAVADADAALKYINDNNTTNYINADVKLMAEATYGSTVTYSSSDTTVVANDGKVTRPTDSDKKVTLTITAVNGEFTEIRTVELVVKKKSSEPAGGGSGGGGGGGGGSYSGGGSSIPKGDINDIIKEDLEKDSKEETPVEPAAPAGVFSDIATHWAKDYIEKMYEAGIVNGKSEGIFAPDDTITREEFITMLVRALGIETIEGGSKFTDVNEDDWFAPFVNAAYKNNITDGMSVDKFGIGANISRQDMCVMIYNAVSAQLETKDASESFSDDNSIASYAKTAVYNLKENGIVNGRGENSFVPQGTATRAEAIKIIFSVKEALTQETEAE